LEDGFGVTLTGEMWRIVKEALHTEQSVSVDVGGQLGRLVIEWIGEEQHGLARPWEWREGN
jgi:hypothetical protein